MAHVTGSTAARREPPGPRGQLLLGNLPALRRDPVRAFTRGWRRYGDVVRFRGPVAMYLVVHPDDVRTVLQERHRDFRHPALVNDKFKRIVGEGLVTSEGNDWLRQRRLTQPMFHRRRISAFGSVMTDATERMLERWEARARDAKPIEIRSEMTRLTLGILSSTLFSADWSREAARLARAATAANEHANKLILSVVALPEWLPVPATRRWLRARRTFDSIVYRLIRERRASGVSADDLLSMLLEARDEETGEGMSDLQIRDEVMTFLMAGHETVSTALAWVWVLLAQHPESARRVRGEVIAALGGRTPTPDDVASLPYTTMVIQEALRLYPPLFLSPRTPVRDVQLGGYDIPAGSFVALCSYVTHRHPAFWDDPEGFDPERFSAERSRSRPRYAYFPFAGGPRQCIGDSYAMLEMQLIVATVVQRFELELLPGRRIEPKAEISLRPDRPVVIRLRPTEATSDSQPGSVEREPEPVTRRA